MTGQGTTHTDFGDTSGPVHSGTGPQQNFFLSIIGAAQHRRTASGLWSTTHLDWLEAHFIKPTEFEKASAALDDRRAVNLTGVPGSGRRTAAMMLLRKRTPRRDRGTRFRELFPEQAEGEPNWDDPELVERDERLLLDLTSVDEDGLRRVEKGLLEFRGVVEARGAFLVIIAHEDVGAGQSAAADLDCRITAPSRTETLFRYLEIEGIRNLRGSPLLQPDRLARLDTWPMREIDRLVKLACVARDGDPSNSAIGWLDQAFNAVTDDGSAVAERVSELISTNQRALHFAAAMHSGVLADAVPGATNALLRILKNPRTSVAVLESPNLAERLGEVGARIDERRRVRFKEFGHDTAVLTYYWDAFPGLRAHLAEWMDSVIRCEPLTSSDRHAIVSRYTVQSLRTDCHRDVMGLIERWTNGSSHTRQLELPRHAMTLLDEGLAHERHGQYFRHEIYLRSAKNTPIHADLASVLIGACLGRLAESHPEQALVRLHHFARRTGEVGELGLDALTRFVEEDDRRFRRLLYRIATAAVPQPANARVFLRIADVRRLTDDRRRSRSLLDNHHIREQLTVGWHLVLSSSQAESQTVLGEWFHVAVVQEHSRDLVLGVLAAAATDFSAASQLEAAAYTWADATDDENPTCTPAQRAALANRLIDDLDRRAQADPPQVPGSTSYREQDPPTTPPASEAFE